MNQIVKYENKRKTVEEVLDFIRDGDDLIVPLANGEPVVLLDTIEANAARLNGVRIHQMHALKERRYIWGEYGDHLRHVAYFLSTASRKAYLAGKCELVPNHFHEVPRILRETTKTSLILASASPIDEHGYFSLGTEADYVASFIGKVPFFLEINKNMPRTFGANQVHISQVAGYIEVDYPLHEQREPIITETDRKIASYVAERITNGATLQCGIGAIPNAIIGFLGNHTNLGIHTELLTDGVVELVEQGVVNGVEKVLHPGKIVATFALGSKKLYDFLDENTGVEMQPVDYVNDPRIIGQEDNMVSINATTEVDFLGQCASETIAGRYYSSTGGQADFARGARFAKNGKGFICLHSTTKDEQISRIRPQLTLGSAVTTSKNDVDHIVTEHGVACMRGKSISQRTRELLNIAHPKFRGELAFEARKFGLI
ncbi:acetyl-CoA hydrolase/transferase C-terminal domain-containing protein [Aneurinibacillus sp. Ricciae_BoGa-3]|uniref:acetyl-CoA hydrolase/transferase family protein n=1 Tax=Aneurinibacillus sp. Ricciae_BoGa-3 TaxID=3022697 RepID=UPI0023410D84|nr:acetyl-CoA hydrolase/transferase C-terminal domain-containing protein [Aneurinibacillus sp. Ricciae_BoGa-3]WCK52480.1 acetyl-CoA hydrolase/transferase C-terminal domain-containing protein [Aneurinibacillus sp. Ricciae_BoGa-3]